MIDVSERLHGLIDPAAGVRRDQFVPDRTRETVDLETPARRATSTIVTRPRRSPSSSRSVGPVMACRALGTYQFAESRP